MFTNHTNGMIITQYIVFSIITFCCSYSIERPSLTYLGILNYTEGDTFAVNLANATNDPFPPIVTSILRFNETFNSFDGQILENNNTTHVADYNVTFNSVQRTQSGQYQLNVSNIAGFDIGGFELNVQCKCY